ncbi:MAG TPA: hypothetical protein VH442_05660 [Micromonosporaceae bacterium]
MSDPPPSAQPAPEITDACSAGGVDDSAYLLAPQDIWPQAPETGQGTATYELDSETCHGMTAGESPPAADCARAYPYYNSDNDMLVEFTHMGVVLVLVGDDMEMNPDGTATATVHEVVANLGPGAGSQLVAQAVECGAKRDGDHYKVVSHGHTTMLLRAGTDQIVALNFTDPTLTDAQRLALLDAAVERASH